MTPAPIHYSCHGRPERYLAFRTETVDGRTLLSLIPDGLEQHPLDVVSCFLDNPNLTTHEPQP